MISNKKYEKLLANYDKHCQRIAKATTVDINEKPQDKAKRIKDNEAEYTKWFEYYFPNFAKVKCAWFHKAIADVLINNKQIYLLAEVFRSGGKTVHINMGIPLYLYLVKKDLFYMILMGQTDPKAKRLLSGIQSQLEHNQRLKNDYGSRLKYGDWSDGNFGTTDGARFRCFGFGQSPRGEQEEGMRPDYISCDDCDIKKHLNNDRLMRERVNFVYEDLIGCFDSADVGYQGTERFVYANNNFHKKSMTNRLKARFHISATKSKQKERKQKHYVFTVEAVKDLNTFEPNWPEKTSADYWREKYDDLGHASFCKEYQHLHVEEGKIFKAEYMQWKKMMPLEAYSALAIYGDLSYKEQGDYKALIFLGKYNREFHFIRTFVRQCDKVDGAKWLYDLWEDMSLFNYNIAVKIEGLFAQDEFVGDFDIEGDERGWHIPVEPDKRSKEGKYDRVAGTVGNFRRRWVYFNIDEKDSADQIELLDQYYQFERGSEAHDDGPDAAHGAFVEVMQMAIESSVEPRIGMIDNTGNENVF